MSTVLQGAQAIHSCSVTELNTLYILKWVQFGQLNFLKLLSYYSFEQMECFPFDCKTPCNSWLEQTFIEHSVYESIMKVATHDNEFLLV